METYIDKINDGETRSMLQRDILEACAPYGEFVVECNEALNPPELVDQNFFRVLVRNDKQAAIITMEPHPFQMFSAQFTVITQEKNQ